MAPRGHTPPMGKTQMTRTLALTAALLLPSLAVANEGAEAEEFVPYSTEGNAHGPYMTNPGLTTGQADGFFKLYVEADEIPAAISEGAGDHVLVMENKSLSWVDVTIGETRVGMLKPLKFGTITGVAAGTYNIAYTLPNGYVRNFTVEATPAE